MTYNQAMDWAFDWCVHIRFYFLWTLQLACKLRANATSGIKFDFGEEVMKNREKLNIKQIQPKLGSEFECVAERCALSLSLIHI